MTKRLAVALIFVIAVGTAGAFALTSQDPAPYPGACGYHPYVAAPPYYWVGEAVSLSYCQNVALPALIARALQDGHVITEAYCRPAKYCA